MGIPIEKSFVVKAPAAAVWDFLTDPVKVASCLPGAAITGQEDGDTWGGTMTVKVGPVTASYRGKLRFERLDAAAGEAEIAASGQETRGKGGADMRMKSRVVARAFGETEVTVTSDVNVVGVLAQFGRGMIQDVSDQIFRKFTEAMRRQLEGAGAAAGAAAVDGAPSVAATTAVATLAPATPAEPLPVAARDGAAPRGAEAPAPAAERATNIETPPPPASTPQPPTPRADVPDVLDVGSIGAAALGRAAARTLRRPAFWIAVVVLGVVVYWFATR
jgi:carbon monoxide dehydrogenase subunit G